MERSAPLARRAAEDTRAGRAGCRAQQHSGHRRRGQRRAESQWFTDEKLYQEALINALGEFADHLPDFQKIDIMMFIKETDEKLYQEALINALGEFADHLPDFQKIDIMMFIAFPAAFLDSLLRLSGAAEPSTRALLQRILHTKHGYAIFTSLYEGLQLESNTLENIEAIYTTLALLVIELGSEETVCDFMQLILAVCVALGLLLPRTRAHDYLLKMALCECLKASGLDPSRLQAPSPYAAGSLCDNDFWHWGHEESTDSSHNVRRERLPHPAQVESVSLEALRRAAGGPSEAERREAERRRATLNSAFRTAPFDHLLHLTQPELSGGRAPPAALGVLAFRFAPESRAAALQVLPGAVPLL
ncbi:hypothetical protein MSG28_013879, partial [Choristoneura fumiferana]